MIYFLCLWLGSLSAATALGFKALGFKAGARFSLVQLLNWIAVPLGWVLLIPFCLAHAWTAPIYRSLKPLPGRENVDQWSWNLLNYWYGEPEDSVSAIYARLNVGGEDPYRPYMPMPKWWGWLPKWATASLTWFWISLRAYLWSAWRNSADNLKYLCAWKDAPPAVQVGGVLLGWRMENGFNVPVLERYP